ncbi:MAG: hypothetical protein AABN95_08305 [Acidobacteriota bacterium]
MKVESVEQQPPIAMIELEVFKVTTFGQGYAFIPRTAATDERLRIVEELLPQSTDVSLGPMIGVLCARLPLSSDIVVCGLSKFPNREEFSRPGVSLTHCIFLRPAKDPSWDATATTAVILTMLEQYQDPRVYAFTGELLGRIAASELLPHDTGEAQEKRFAEMLRLTPESLGSAKTRLDELGFGHLVEWYESTDPPKRINITSCFPFSKHTGFCVASASLLAKRTPFVAVLGKLRQGVAADILSSQTHVHGYEPVDLGSLIGRACKRPAWQEEGHEARSSERPIKAPPKDWEQAQGPAAQPAEWRPDDSAPLLWKRTLRTMVPLQGAMLAALSILVLVSFVVLHRLSVLSSNQRSFLLPVTSPSEDNPSPTVKIDSPDAEDQRIYNTLIEKGEMVIDHLPTGWDIPEADPAAAVVRHLGRVLSQKGVRVRIEIHTDLTGSSQINLNNARRRAKTIEALLAQGGQLSGDQVQMIPIGKERPLRPSELTPADRLANRRIVVSKIA